MRGGVRQELHHRQEVSGVCEWLQQGRLQADSEGEMLPEEDSPLQPQSEQSLSQEVPGGCQGPGDLSGVQAGGLSEGSCLSAGAEGRGGLSGRGNIIQHFPELTAQRKD